MKKIMKMMIMSICLATTSFSTEVDSLLGDDFASRNRYAITSTTRILKPIFDINPHIFADLSGKYVENSAIKDLCLQLLGDSTTLKKKHITTILRLEILQKEIDRTCPTSLQTSTEFDATESTAFIESVEISSPTESPIRGIIKKLQKVTHVNLDWFRILSEEQSQQDSEPIGLNEILFRTIGTLKEKNISLIEELETLDEKIKASYEDQAEKKHQINE